MSTKVFVVNTYDIQIFTFSRAKLFNAVYAL